MRLALLTGIVILIKLVAASSPAYADMSDETRSRALTAITDTAEKICGSSIPTSGEQNSIQIKGTITAELNGLAKKLADLGISGAGDLSSTTYEGLLQKDLPAALNDARGCRMHIFDTLQEKFLPNQKSGSAWLDPIGAQVEDNIAPGKPIITDVRYVNIGNEPVQLIDIGDPILFTVDQWSNGTAKYVSTAMAENCMLLRFLKRFRCVLLTQMSFITGTFLRMIRRSLCLVEWLPPRNS